MRHPQFSPSIQDTAASNVVTLRFRETRLAAPRTEPTFTAPREAARAAAREAAGIPFGTARAFPETRGPRQRRGVPEELKGGAENHNPFMPQARPAENILMDIVMLLTVTVFIAGVYAALAVFS